MSGTDSHDNDSHVNDPHSGSVDDTGVTDSGLADLQTTIRRVDATASGSVVSIGRNGRGSGFVIATDRVLTSAHNLRDQTVSVTFADARVEQGSLHGADPDGDLVVVSVPTGDAPPLEFADATPAVGTAVIALARGGHRPRTTLGFVSGVDRSFDGPRGRIVRGGFEHTAALARGSSGGPVLDAQGKVLGVNTHRVGDGFYLARTTDAALQARIADLAAGQSVQRRTLGVALAPADVAAKLRRAVGLAERAGLLVRGLVEGGAAAAAGVQVGDLIVRAGGIDLVDVEALQNVLDVPELQSIWLNIVRGSDERTVIVTFADAPAQPPA
jgi:serine protease Do